MTRRLVRLALAAAAVSAVALPAAPASAQCEGTFVFHCIRELLPETMAQNELCLVSIDTTGTYVCV